MVVRNFKAWKRRWRQARQARKLAVPAGYPADMHADTVETIISVRHYTMTSTERLHGLCEAVRYISETGIEGDIVECGVWRGGSMMAIAKMLQNMGDTSRHLHLFDTFEGMSEPTAADIALDGQSASQQLANEDKNDGTSVWCVASLSDVQTHMSQTHYPSNRVHYHVGKVEETIPHEAPQKIALLRLDTDWFESTAHEMEHLFPRLADGGVLILDDYGHWQGARRAVDDYFAKHHVGMMLHRLDYTGRIGINHAGVARRRAAEVTREAA